MKDVEKLLGFVLRLGVAISTAALIAGLVLVSLGNERQATRLLAVGVLILIATPFARVVVSSISYALRREWTFVLLTLIVLAELVASIVAAVKP